MQFINEDSFDKVDAMYKNLILELEALLAVVTLNRPQCRHALSLDLLQELLDCLGQMEHDRSA
jgi:enoyl-CoA hydratase/carnithine racemase